MKIEFKDYKDKHYSIPTEDIKSVEPSDFNEIYVKLENGDYYKAFGEIRFIK